MLSSSLISSRIEKTLFSTNIRLTFRINSLGDLYLIPVYACVCLDGVGHLSLWVRLGWAGKGRVCVGH